MWRGLGTRKRDENHVVAKADVSVFNGANLGVTYTRLRPFTLEPRPVLNNANDREFPERAGSHRRAVRDDEGRVGVGEPCWLEQDLSRPTRRVPEQRSVQTRRRRFSRTAGASAGSTSRGLFATADAEIWDMAGTTYSFEQKFSRGFQRHLVKAGFRFMRETGGRLNPEIPKFMYNNYADLLANIPTSRTRRTAPRRTSRTWTTTAPSSRTTGAWAAASC